MSRTFIFFGIVMLVIVTLAWGAVSLYDARASTELDPTAQQRSLKIKSSFDTDALRAVQRRLDELAIKSETFHALELNTDESAQ